VTRTNSLRNMIRGLILALALSFLPIPAAAFIYYANSIEARVIDARTGGPVQGAIVTANWQLEGGIESGIAIDQLKILETTTDVNGKFTIPGWGPKFSFHGHASFKWPQILVFKSGYKSLRLTNEPRSGSQFTTSSDWNAKTITLENFAGTLAEYVEHLSSLSSTLENVGYNIGYQSGNWCGWKSFPRMLRALDELEARLRSADVRQGTVVSFLRANETQVKEKGCGSVSEFLNGLGK
jgi:hypothetical protein